MLDKIGDAAGAPLRRRSSTRRTRPRPARPPRTCRLALGGGRRAGADRRRGRGRRAASRGRSTRRGGARARRSARVAASRTSRSSPSPRRRRAGRWSCSARSNPQTASYEPFHLYSMRQAIEEGFILDVLANYTTYQTYWQIEKAIDGRPRVRRREGAASDRAVRHPAPAQPRPEGRDHRRALPRSTRATKIGGQAKAMVVTSSRLHAVRYKQAHRHVHRRARATPTSRRSWRSRARSTTARASASPRPSMNGFPERQTAEQFGSAEYGC